MPVEFQNTINETILSVQKYKRLEIIGASELNICISIKRYNGDYKMCRKGMVKKKCIPIEYKLSLISSFGIDSIRAFV